MQYTKLRLMVGGLALAMAGTCVHSETLQPDPAWQEGKLSNGLSWQILATPQRPSDRIELRMIVNTGSLSESPQQMGYAHLLPRLALAQGKGLDAPALQSFWQQAIDPARPMPTAITSYDYTSYNLSLPNNRPDLMKDALRWLANTAGDLQVNAETVGEALKGADSRVMAQPGEAGDPWWRYRLKGSNLLGHEPGRAAVVPLAPTQLKAFYHQWYTPDAITLYVVGNVDARALSEQINQTFGSLSGQRETPATVPALPALAAAPVSLIADGTQQDILSLVWDTPWQPIRDSQMLLRYWRSDLAREALFWHLQQVLANSALKGSVNLSFNCQVQYQRSQCAIHLETAQASLSKTLAFIADEMSALRDDGITQTEFDTLLGQKNDQLSHLFATYARTNTEILMSQRLRSQQSGVVDIAPEAYQKLRQTFLSALTLDDINQELHIMLSREPAVVLRQPRGEAEENVGRLLEEYNRVMGLEGEEAVTAETVDTPSQPAAAENPAHETTPSQPLAQ
ncbi:insulinase family protein [Edwardsiella ictaluri]|uniref:Peptidase M16 family protein n=1 Tax=Edwardsiella ictaluri (strain 93-146) TaxID=634503 RepID=C5BB34_EDWI9|nr:pitrilysin family protein [Edwardsiella ictaluri]ACR70876.1 peptidase M16 family protein [Edwardsiella ictaluri 93-146]AVZ82348.1 insulinase family protein [Edwardsiella ictaluri]EKS7762777.1 insulinase family protein [Edwardsiella ictaluri]EKS7769689.1 insulinase family protein [Edwardsiella ictaluri]EKS7772742.1 insulinase family protein [Edwardsiella ictaluri]